jgi:hypothetical protein
VELEGLNLPFSMFVVIYFSSMQFYHVDYLCWFSLISTLEESLVANFGSKKVWVVDPSLFHV